MTQIWCPQRLDFLSNCGMDGVLVLERNILSKRRKRTAHMPCTSRTSPKLEGQFMKYNRGQEKTYFMAVYVQVGGEVLSHPDKCFADTFNSIEIEHQLDTMM